MCGDLLSEITSALSKDAFIVSSVPSNLNIVSAECTPDGDDVTGDRWSSSTHRNSNHWPDTLSAPPADSVASKNLDLAQSFGVTAAHHAHHPPQTLQQQKIINSSYSNLTLLDYSNNPYGGRGSFNQLRSMAEKRRQSPSASNRNSTTAIDADKSSLLDEISAHFDRSLSILNDKKVIDDEIDMTDGTVLETKAIACVPATASKVAAPLPPPRKHQAKSSAPIANDHRASLPPNDRYTFDRDPTNLKTCYAESLEKCNFDLAGSANSINLLENSASGGVQFSPSKHSTPIKHELIASTPNLYQHRGDRADSDEYLQTSSAYNSLNPLPHTETVVPTKSILSAGSRGSLGKGVSFYPFVSEISWHEQSSVDATPDLSDDDNEDESR